MCETKSFFFTLHRLQLAHYDDDQTIKDVRNAADMIQVPAAEQFFAYLQY